MCFFCNKNYCFFRYFDADGDEKVNVKEFRAVFERDMASMASHAKEKKPEGRRRDPGIGWILDFNNDGVVSIEVFEEYFLLDT